MSDYLLLLAIISVSAQAGAYNGSLQEQVAKYGNILSSRDDTRFRLLVIHIPSKPNCFRNRNKGATIYFYIGQASQEVALPLGSLVGDGQIRNCSDKSDDRFKRRRTNFVIVTLKSWLYALCSKFHWAMAGLPL